MSPTEDELRAALRHGEGDGPDASAITAAGRRAARRRATLLNGAAAVVLIGALGTGGAFLLSGNGNDQTRSDTAGGAAKAPAKAQIFDRTKSGSSAGGGVRGPVAPSAAAPAATGCPADVPAAPSPGTGTTGPLFTATPDAITVCTYAGAGSPGVSVLTGTDARTVATSLESAATTRPAGMCPQYRIADERTVELLGTAGGKPVGVVTTTLDRPACATVVTNGKVVRYGWTAPKELLQHVTPLGGRSHGPVAETTSPSK